MVAQRSRIRRKEEKGVQDLRSLCIKDLKE
jgi:hypothetical protein